MKDSFVYYLHSIGMTETLMQRISTIFDFYSETCPDEITDIFVTDYIKQDGTREYENIWFFSSLFCMEAKLFITADDFDITPFKNRIVRWKIEKQNYIVTRATDQSRATVDFSLDTGVYGKMKASKENCDYLWVIIQKYISPNLKK